jgi:hypothetical protein
VGPRAESAGQLVVGTRWNYGRARDVSELPLRVPWIADGTSTTTVVKFELLADLDPEPAGSTLLSTRGLSGAAVLL